MAILSTGLEKLQHFALAPTAQRTANLDGTAIDMNDYEGDLVIILDVEAGGTSTLDVKIQSSDTSGGSYTDVTTVFNRGGTEQASGAVAPKQAPLLPSSFWCFLRALLSVGSRLCRLLRPRPTPIRLMVLA